MAKLLTVDVDTTALFAALDTLGDAAQPYVKAAAKISADNIDREQTARVARRTGQTAARIVVEETRDGLGWVVFVNQPENPGLAGWLEHGTDHMTRRPFFFAPARLEEVPHFRRIGEALQDAIDAKGLGD